MHSQSGKSSMVKYFHSLAEFTLPGRQGTLFIQVSSESRLLYSTLNVPSTTACSQLCEPTATSDDGTVTFPSQILLLGN